MIEPTGRVLAELLQLDAPRPAPDDDLIRDLWTSLKTGTADALSRADEDIIYTKGRHAMVGRCAGFAVAATEAGFDASQPPAQPVVVGWCVHAAIQATQVCPGLPVDDYVRDAVSDVRAKRPSVDEWMAELNAVELSAFLSAVVQAVHAWLADWPWLRPKWRPQWEVPMRVTVGGEVGPALVMMTRPDLVLGRPRVDMRVQIVVDVKTGALTSAHHREARWHALMAALRYHVAPWRSTVYSTASGSWTSPAVTAETLWLAVEEVIDGVRTWAETVVGGGDPQLTPGPHCTFCVASRTCPAAAVHGEVGAA